MLTAMKKTHKKIDNNLIKSLTLACEEIKDVTEFFTWLTHEANYDKFPQSLIITCYFSDENALIHVRDSELNTLIRKTIEQQLTSIGINSFNINKQIKYAIDS